MFWINVLSQVIKTLINARLSLCIRASLKKIVWTDFKTHVYEPANAYATLKYIRIGRGNGKAILGAWKMQAIVNSYKRMVG